MPYKLKIFTDWSKFADSKNQIDQLVDANNSTTIFQSFGWYKCWWQAFGQNYRLLVAGCYQGDKLVGLFPLMANADDELEFLANPESEYQDIVMHPEHKEATKIFFTWLVQLAKKYPIKLWEIPETSYAAHSLKSFLRQNGKLHYSLSQNSTYQAHLSQPLNKQDIKHRHNKLQRLGRLDIVTTTNNNLDDNTLSSFFNLLRVRFSGHPSYYRKRQLSQEFNQFYKLLKQEFSQYKGGDGFSIAAVSLDDRPVALTVHLSSKLKLYGLLQTFDPKFGNYSPGSILLQRSINDNINTGIKIFDFLRGQESYKMRFANASTPLIRITIYPRAWQQIAAQILTSTKRLLKPAIMNLYNTRQKLRKINWKDNLKIIFFWVLWFSGLTLLYLSLTKRRRRILCYHSVSDHPLAASILSVRANIFRKQMLYTKELITKGHNLDLTFDDGYQDNFTNVFPVLRELKLPATIFPTIQFIEQGFVPAWTGEPDFPALTWGQINEMYDSNLVKFGSHTLTHPRLSNLNFEQINEELLSSKQTLKSKIVNLQAEIDTVAYPFGKRKDFNKAVIKLARQLGYTSGYTILEGTDSKKTNSMLLKRLVIFDEPIFMFKVRISGLLDDLQNLLKIPQKKST